MNSNKLLGELVKQAREEKGWSQQELADEMNCDLRTIQRLEAGNGNPSFTTLAAYLFLLDISSEILFNEKSGENGVIMDHIFRELLTLNTEQIQLVCQTAIYMRQWKNDHANVTTLEDYCKYMSKSVIYRLQM
jgi:transcriptional regulator with XRE-family HTH domain